MTNSKFNCLSHWYPKLEKTGVKTPKTLITRTDLPLMNALEGQEIPGVEALFTELDNLAVTLGYPCFLRTGQGSAKHYWEDTCFLKSKEDIPKHVVELVEWSCLVHIMGLPYDVWVVRELLETAPHFHAFKNMPITRERRFFIDKGKIIGQIPYWPAGAFEDALHKPDDWREKLREMNDLPSDDEAYLHDETFEVAHEFEGPWSVDWLQVKNGDWYCIDMAVGPMSYGWDQVTGGADQSDEDTIGDDGTITLHRIDSQEDC
jgi:hypothetical protein